MWSGHKINHKSPTFTQTVEVERGGGGVMKGGGVRQGGRKGRRRGGEGQVIVENENIYCL